MNAQAQILLNWRLRKDSADNAPGPAYAAPQRPTVRRSGGRGQGGAIAIVQIFGTILPRASMLNEMCGATSTQQVRSAIFEALADDTVGQIVLEFDSPGGSVSDVQELADDIFAAKSRKPIVGFANSMAASAAYWLMSQCTECYVTPSGQVGSIGVYVVHENLAKALANAGIEVTIISAGRFKTEGHPYGPLAEEARSATQEGIDTYYRAFTRQVARGRGVSVDTVRNGMGQGRVLNAQQALSERMVDGVMPMAALLGQLMRSPAKGNAQRPGAVGASTMSVAQARREIDMIPSVPTPRQAPAREAARRYLDTET